MSANQITYTDQNGFILDKLLNSNIVRDNSVSSLTNKTLVNPIISSIINGGNTLTLPNTVDTLVGRNTTDQLINKSISGINNTLTNISQASITNGYIDLTSNQNITGNKTFLNNINALNLSNTNTGDETQATIKSKLGVATSFQDGYLSSNDFFAFSNKLTQGGILRFDLQSAPSTLSGSFYQYNDNGTLPQLVWQFGSGFKATWNNTGFTGNRTYTLPNNSGTLALFSDLTKSNLGLANVDNTSDLSKPISTATQTALNLKQTKVCVTVGTTNADYLLTSLSTNHTVINQAISDLSTAGGGIIDLLDKDIEIRGSIVPRSNVWLRGQGLGKTRIFCTATSTPSYLFLNNGTTLGSGYVNNFTLSDLTLDANSRNCGGIAVFYYNNWRMQRVKITNILAASAKWSTKFGTIAGSYSTSRSSSLYVNFCIYENNYGGTYEQLLYTNTVGGDVSSNLFKNNSSRSANYDEISNFIFNENVDVHDNILINSAYHGIGVKESNNCTVHDNIVVRNTLSHRGLRSYNTGDSSFYDNTVIFPDPITAQVTISGGTTVTITDSNTTANMFVGQKVICPNLPENTKVNSITNSTTFVVNQAGTNGTGLSCVLTNNAYGFEQADRNIGFDGQPQKNAFTNNLSIKRNKFKNVRYGIFSGLSSLGVDKTVTANLSGTTITFTTGDTTGLEVEERCYSGTLIPDGTYIVSIDSSTQVTVSETLTTATGVSVFFDSNTITYRAKNTTIENNEFDGITQNAIKWGINSPDTNTKGMSIKHNRINDWYGSNDSCISLVGDTASPSSFSGVIIEGNQIGDNLERTNNGGISLSAVQADSIKGNTQKTFGTRGKIQLSNGSTVTDNDFAPLIITASISLTWQNVVIADITTGAITINLPDATLWVGKQYTLIKTDISSNAAVINPFGLQTINGATNFSLTNQYDNITVQSNGTNWIIISRNKSVTLDEAFGNGQSIINSVGENRTFTVTNADTTNNNDTFIINNSTSGFGSRVNQTGVLATNKHAFFVDNSAAQINAILARIRNSNAGSTTTVFNLNNAGSGNTLLLDGTNTQSTGTFKAERIAPTINQTGSAGYTALEVDITETALGTGTKRLVDLRIAGVSQFIVDNTGKITAKGLDNGSQKITNLADGTTSTDGVNKGQLDGKQNKTFAVVGTTNADYTISGANADIPIENAINAINTAGGGLVFIRNGTHVVSPTSARITLKSNVTITGEDKYKTIIQGNAGYTSDYLFGAFGNTGVDNITIQNLTMDVNNVTAGSAIRLEYATNIRIKNCVIKNVPNNGWGIAISTPFADRFSSVMMNKNIIIEDCEFDNFDSTLEELLLMNIQGIVIKNCKFNDNIRSSGPGIGIYQYCDDVEIHSNTFTDIAGPSIYYSLSTNNIAIHHNKFYGTGSGGTGVQGANISDNGAFSFNWVRNLSITNNFFTNLYAGVQIGGTEGAIVHDNHFWFNKEIAIQIHSGNNGHAQPAQRYSVKGNTFHHNNAGVSNARSHPAIFVSGPAGNVYGSITQNKFYNPESAKDQIWSIGFYGQDTSNKVWDYITISDNYLENYDSTNRESIFFDNGASLGDNCQITNNDYINPNLYNNLGNITGSVSITRRTAREFFGVLTGNVTLTLENAKFRRDELYLYLSQDATGGRTITLPGNVITKSPFALETGANKQTVLALYFDGTNWVEQWRSSNAITIADGDKGDITVSGSGATWTLDNSGVTAGTYRNQSFDVDVKGRITGATNYRYYQKNDFIAGYHDMTVLGTSGAGSAATLASASYNGFVGALYLATGTTATGGAGRRFETTDWAGQFQIKGESLVRLLNLSDGTDTYSTRVGFINNTTAESTNGLYFRYSSTLNSGKWECVAFNNNVSTITDSGVTVAAGTNYTLRIEVNSAGTSADYYINNTLVQTITTNIPSANVGRGSGWGANIIKSVGTTSRIVVIDYYEVIMF